MKYKAYLKQWAEGCDYTVGCGKTVIELEAENIEQAKQKLTDIIIKDYSDSDRLLESCDLYEINEVFRVDVALVYRNEEKIKEDRERKLREEEEREEFERLKLKFES